MGGKEKGEALRPAASPPVEAPTSAGVGGKGRDAVSSFGTHPQAEAEAWRRHFGPTYMEEIRRAISDMDNGRAPGLD